MSRVTSSGNYLKTAANAVYNNLHTFTVAAWIYITSNPGSGNIGVIAAKDPLHAYSIFLQIDGGSSSVTLEGGLSTNGDAQSSTTIPLNTWTHVLMTFDLTGTKIPRLYINGVEVSYAAQVANTATSDDSADGFYFGDDTFSDGFPGRIAEMAIWSDVLSGANITAAAASTTGVGSIDSSHLVGYWHFCGTASPEPDATANNDSATLVGTPTQGPDSPGFSCAAGPSTVNKLHNIDGYVFPAGSSPFHSVDTYVAGNNKNHNVDCYVQTSSDHNGLIPFVVASQQFSGNPTNFILSSSPISGLQVGDVVVVFVNFGYQQPIPPFPQPAFVTDNSPTLLEPYIPVVGVTPSPLLPTAPPTSTQVIVGTTNGFTEVGYLGVLTSVPGGGLIVIINTSQVGGALFNNFVNATVVVIRNANTQRILQDGGLNSQNIFGLLQGSSTGASTGNSLSSGPLHTKTPNTMAIGGGVVEPGQVISGVGIGWNLLQDGSPMALTDQLVP